MNRALLASATIVAAAFVAGWIFAGADAGSGLERTASEWRAPDPSVPQSPETDWLRIFNAAPPPEVEAVDGGPLQEGRMIAIIERGADAFLLVRGRDGDPVRLRLNDPVGLNGWRVLTLNPTSVEFGREGRTRVFSVFGAGRSALEEFLDGELSCPQGEECA